MKPEGAITYEYHCDLTEYSLRLAFAELTNKSPIRGHYILKVHPSEILDAGKVISNWWPALLLDTHDWPDEYEWSLTAFKFDGQDFIHRTFWSEGA